MTILITGGTGFIGSHVVKRLVQLGHTLVVTKRLNSDLSKLQDILEDIEFIDNDFKSLEYAFKHYSFECIIHTAGLLKVETEDIKNTKLLFEANVQFGTSLLILAEKYNVKKFINTGSFFEEEILQNNKSILNPHNYYAVTKLMFEETLKYFTYKYNMQTITLRLYTPYGEGDNMNKLIPSIIYSLLNNRSLTINNSEQRLNLIYIEDVVKAYCLSLEKLNKTEKAYYKKLDIGSNKTYLILEIVNILRKFYNSGDKLIISQEKKKIHTFSRCNGVATSTSLGWKPQIKLEEGLKKTFLYYLNIKQINYE